MKGLSSVTDAEHTVEWQINLTHVLLLLLALYVVYKTDVLEGVDGDAAAIAVEVPA